MSRTEKGGNGRGSWNLQLKGKHVSLGASQQHSMTCLPSQLEGSQTNNQAQDLIMASRHHAYNYQPWQVFSDDVGALMGKEGSGTAVGTPEQMHLGNLSPLNTPSLACPSHFFRREEGRRPVGWCFPSRWALPSLLAPGPTLRVRPLPLAVGLRCGGFYSVRAAGCGCTEQQDL